MKLGGWTRLGIALSGLWLVLIGTLIIFQINTATRYQAGFLVRLAHGRAGDPAPYTFNTSHSPGAPWDAAVVDSPVAIALVVVSLVIIWLAVPSFVFLFRWVRRGFEDTN